MKRLQTIARIVHRNSAFRSASTRTQQQSQGRQRPRPPARSQNQKNEKRTSHNNHRNSNNAAYQRRRKMVTTKGLEISQEQIQRLWNLFEYRTDDHDDINTSSNKFDVQDFVSKYPNVNPTLAKKIREQQGVNEIDDPSFSLNMKNRDENVSNFKFSPVAEEAEQKLQRMLDKIDQHENLTPDIQIQVQNLLLQELETVLDLWLKISQSSECQTLQQAMAPVDRAAELLLKFQNLHEKGVKLISKNPNAFFPPAPAIRSYQSVIQGYHLLFSSVENDMNLSVRELEHVQGQSRNIIKGMMKQVITERMRSLDSESSDRIVSSNSHLSNPIPLHDSYNCAIKMYVDLPIQNMPLKGTPTSACSPDTKHLTEMANTASQLLQEMELYYHDFHTMPIPVSTSASAPTTSLQSFLTSIHPTRESFKLVIRAFVNIAEKTDCKYSIRRASDVIERMGKRYQAYVVKTKQEGDNAHVSGPADGSGVIEQVCRPDLELYAMIFQGYAIMGNLVQEDVEIVGKMLKTLEDDDSKIVTDDIRNLISVIQEKSGAAK
jgi:hypothetical protein